LEIEMLNRLVVAIGLAVSCSLCAAQTTVYESKDKVGPVFSDQPSPGAVVIDLPPPNVIEVVPAAAVPPPVDTLRRRYRALAIVAPANGTTLHTNTGDFSVSTKSTPAWRSGAGDSIRVKLDGVLLPSRYRSASFKITPADWRMAAAVNVEHTLQAAIVDGTGAEIVQSTPVTFYVHRATVRRH
jgi:hypothetical protein